MHQANESMLCTACCRSSTRTAGYHISFKDDTCGESWPSDNKRSAGHSATSTSKAAPKTVPRANHKPLGQQFACQITYTLAALSESSVKLLQVAALKTLHPRPFAGQNAARAPAVLLQGPNNHQTACAWPCLAILVRNPPSFLTLRPSSLPLLLSRPGLQ